ncbi:MAG TPA: hypothetical protein VFE47_04645 [Tepidisphaeraceae bacterium]|jgi:hypothetical protein|nr:hypothetical protein [Tepidisphaeraceae bacterium]
MSDVNSNFFNTALVPGKFARMDKMNEQLDIKSENEEPIQSGARPIVAAAIVFSPIIIAVVLLIFYVLVFSKRGL